MKKSMLNFIAAMNALLLAAPMRNSQQLAVRAHSAHTVRKHGKSDSGYKAFSTRYRINKITEEARSNVQDGNTEKQVKARAKRMRKNALRRKNYVRCLRYNDCMDQNTRSALRFSTKVA